ncbi:MAG: hypothetical protein ACREMQ_14405, partial [Longimicrobiales bacterium]
MAESRSPRRAVFVADPVTGSWHVGRSRGWQSDAAAQEAVWLLDTDGASLLVPDFAGFFSLARGSWAVVRGGVAPPPNRTGRYRREAIALEEKDFARVRYNPFRILPDIGGDSFETPEDELPTPEIPNQLEPADDISRLRELESRSRDQRPAAELEALLAAVLDRDHSLATGSRWSYEDLELLMLLLPPPLRPRLTFHSFATSIPPDPVPRLVLTRLTDGRAFEGASPVWGHRLPGTVAEIPATARNAAGALIELLATPERLVDAHEAYAQHVRAEGANAGLLAEVETLLRVARRAGRQQTPHDAALRALMEAATINTGGPLDDGGRGEVTPETLGNAVARRLRSGQRDLAAPALVMERFFSRRDSHPGHFAEFARRLDGVLDGLALPEDENATRIRTMLLLLAATRGDAAGVADALVVPVPRDMIARLGGISAWVSPGQGRAAEAVRALALADDAESTVDAVTALADLGRELPAGPRRVRLAQAGLQTIRTAYRRLPAERWEAGLAISTAGLDLFESAASSGPLGSHSLQAEVENEIGLSDRSDSEVFLGFLGVASSPCSLSRSEIADGGDALVEEVLDRIRRRNEIGDPAAEAAHWSFALLDRVRHGQVDDSACILAAKLLRLAAPEGAGRALAAYLEQYPDAVTWLFDHGELSRLLDDEERVILYTGALQRALDAAADSADTREVITLCKRLRDGGLQFGAPALRLKFESRLHSIAATIRENQADTEATTQVSALQSAMASVVDRDGLAALQGMLAPPEPPRTEEPQVVEPEPDVIPL